MVNRSAHSHNALKATAEVLSLYGEVLAQAVHTLDIGIDSTVALPRITPPDSVRHTYYIRLTLKDAQGGVLSTNFYVESKVEGDNTDLLSLPRVDVEHATTYERTGGVWTATTTLRNAHATPAMMIRLNLRAADGGQILPATYSDNYFHLMPGEAKVVVTTFRDEDTRGERPVMEVDW